jgi:hypothetical protein
MEGRTNPLDTVLKMFREMDEERKNTDNPIIVCLGSIFGKYCVWHAIVPTMLSSIYVALQNNPEFTLGLRVVVSKSALLDNNWDYHFGFDWVLICIECCGAKNIMDVSRPQLDYLENWIDSIAGNHCCESLSRDVSAPDLWREVRSQIDAQYFAILDEFGGIRNACYNCNLKNPRNRCARCKLVRYCNEECSKAHWKRHKDACEMIASRKSVFEKEASYKVLFKKE